MKKPLFQKISIVGVGLMGGSLGLAIKKKKLARAVIGVTRRKATIDEAFRRNALDTATLDLAKGVEDADLVILCAPVSVITKQMRIIAPKLKRGAIIIDVGSSKALIEKESKKYFKKNLFVGCHPMAGSEKSGIDAASADLFEGSVCFVTKNDRRIVSFWKKLGSRPVVVSAKKHDRIVGAMSHAPHAIAFSLFQKQKEYPAGIPVNPSMRALARLAQSDPALWADIFISNRAALLRAIEEFEKKGLHPLKNLLRRPDRAALERFIAASNRNSLEILPFLTNCATHGIHTIRRQ